jgi:hypothetical protein
MQIRVNRALAAAALLGLAATAEAQTPTRIPVTKDRNPTPVDTVQTMPARRDTVYLRDTVTVYRTDTVTVTQQASTGIVATETPLVDLPGPLYFQLGGGVSMPRAQFGDYFDNGFNVTGSLGWQPVNSALGFRFDASYDKWAGENINFGNNEIRDSDASVFSGLANATFNLPFGNRANGSGFYLIGGGGLHYFNDYADMRSSGFGTGEADEDTSLDWGLNGGAGLRFGFGRAALFAESRYFHVFTEGERTNFLPIVIGFTFR